MRIRLSIALLSVFVLSLSMSGPLPAADEKPKEPTTATLAHIRLTGDLGEAPVPADPLFGGGAENFKMKLDRIKKAKDDTTVGALYLHIDGLAVGNGKIDELRHAIADFRKSGKRVYAYLDSVNSMGEYLVACACDEVCLPQSGWVMTTGVRAEITFYKDLFDKIGVKADMLQMGAFKGAAEPMTRSSMSKEFRAQYEKMIDDIYDNTIAAGIAASRTAKKWTPERVKKIIDEAPYTAKGAQEVGLIDRVAYEETFLDGVKEQLKADRLKVVKNYGQAKGEDLKLSNPFDLLKLFSPTTASISGKPKVAVIYATGAIVTGKGGGGLLGGESCGSTTMVEAIKQAEAEKTVKAIVLRVDSPGGSALASDLIWKELHRCKKPVIASMSDVAASGGYYISMGAGKVYAEPGTITGSIGVVGGKLTLGGLEKNIGLNTETISRGANASIFSQSSPFTDSEKKAMTVLMRDVYDQFMDRVLENRNNNGKKLTKAHLENDLAGGRIWTGRQALEQGLVDELGTLNDAVAAAWKAASQTGEPEWMVLPKARDLVDQILDMRTDAESSMVARKVLEQLPGVGGKLRAVDAMLKLRNEPVWAIVPYHVEVK